MTMPRYIDLGKQLVRLYRLNLTCEDVIKEFLLSAETVNVPNRKVGKWIHDGYDFPHGNDWIHCSVCGKRGINVPADLSNFCPNCGAEMSERGDADD